MFQKPSQTRPQAHREQRVLERPIYDIQEEEVQKDFPEPGELSSSSR